MDHISILQKFRQQLYFLIPKRCDATLDLIDSLSSNNEADSVTKLSLSPFFRRKYNSITKVINSFLYRDYDFVNGKRVLVLAPCEKAHKKLATLIANHCHLPKTRNFFLFGVDETSCLRPYAKTLEDRGIVHSANQTPGNKPIGVGHSFSLLAQLPEKEVASSWLLPLDIKRVKTSEKGHEIGIEQIKQQLSEPSTPFYNKLCVLVADSLYNTKFNWQQTSQHDNLVFISRMKRNRNTYSPAPPNQTRKKYGKKMKLNDTTTHRQIDEKISFYRKSASGKDRYIQVKIWHNQLLRGDHKFKGYEHPMTLIEITVCNAKTKKPLFKRPLWLSIYGERRSEISIEAVCDSYFQRFDLEHFFRFGKNRLLMDKFQTPDIEHEINWWKIVQIAYVQLFLSRKIAKSEPYPWESYLPTYRTASINNEVSPSQTQRHFDIILKQIGTPAKSVQCRSIGTGRLLGEVQSKREIHEIIFKKSSKKTTKTNVPEKPKEDVKKTTKNDEKEQISGFEKSLKNLRTLNLNSMSSIVRDLLQKLHVDENDFTEKLANLMPT